jgi:hypothetical protein
VGGDPATVKNVTISFVVKKMKGAAPDDLNRFAARCAGKRSSELVSL